MSIIYDALKKTQENITPHSTETKPVKNAEPLLKSKPKKISFLLYALIISAGIILGNILLGFLPRSKSPVPAAAKPLSSAKKPVLLTRQELPRAAAKRKKGQKGMVLNGVFFSENKGYALINNRIVKEGDVLDEGRVIQRIGMTDVEIIDANGAVIKLSNP